MESRYGGLFSQVWTISASFHIGDFSSKAVLVEGKQLPRIDSLHFSSLLDGESSEFLKLQPSF